MGQGRASYQHPSMQTHAAPSATMPLPASHLEARSYDHWHVDGNEAWEVEFWMRHLDCDEQSLRDAVSAVGARVGAVRAYLATHSRHPS